LTPELAEVVAAWPLGASLAAAGAAAGLREGRRRTALNEALHELRRPLQALALVIPGATSAAESSQLQGAVQMAATALERLEREVNGEPDVPVRSALAVRPLLDSAVERWRARAALGGGCLTLRWRAGEVLVEGDRGQLARAVDNLIANAIEHGGPEIAIEALGRPGWLRVAVRDSGRREPRSTSGHDVKAPASRASAGLVARLSGRRLRGHGLRIVRRIAASHGGEFHLRRSPQGTEAVLELPLPAGRR
jgi:signal transduction histidine kinase